MIKGLSSQQPTPSRDRAPAALDVPAALPVQEASSGVLTRDSLQKAAEAKLGNRNVFAQLETQDLLDLLQKGSLPHERAPFVIDGSGIGIENLAVQLSDEGKKALWVNDGLAEALLAGQSQSPAPKALVQLDTHIEEILVSPENKDSLLKAYGERVATGEAPEAIAGKPFKTFFNEHVRATEDLRGDIELKNFRKQVPGFTSLPLTEQRVRASLGGKLAESWPMSIPGDVRRQMANSMIRHKTFDRPAPGAGLKVAGELKEFFHGTNSGKLISRIGFRGQPELLFKKLPENTQQFLGRKFGIRFGSFFGTGVYYGNATVASGYAVGKLDNLTKPVQVVSGLVAMGKTTLQDFAEAADADTRIVPNADANGAYYVTRDPRRFTVKALTTLDPKQTDGLMRFFPQILKAHADSPYQIGPLVDRLPKAPARRALEEALKSSDPATVTQATLLLARRGDEGALASTLKRLEGVGSARELESFQTTLLTVLKSMGPGNVERTAPIAEAMLKTGMRVLPKEASFGNPLEILAYDLFSTLGEEIRPMVERHGFKLNGSMPTEGWLDRAVKAASKGFKRLL